MKVQFNINYPTRWGQNLYLLTDLPHLKEQTPGVAMAYSVGNHWSVEIDVPDRSCSFSYRYAVCTDDVVTVERCEPRHLQITPARSRHILIDSWEDYPSNRPFLSSAFTEVIFAREPITPPAYELKREEGVIRLIAFAPTLSPDFDLGMTGHSDQLGNWGERKVLRFNYQGAGAWQLTIPASGLETRNEYKLVSLRRGTTEIVEWEEGENRRMDFEMPQLQEEVVVRNLYFRGGQPRWRGAGTAIPVFSLRSEHSWGIGDFVDLRWMIDWVAQTGQRLLQLLPVNDTTLTHTWVDSYPYNANSIYALHPLYLSLSELPPLKSKTRMAEYERSRKELNSLAEVDYERVGELKWAYLKELFIEQSESFYHSEEYLRWYGQNEEWLLPYAAFSLLRDRFQTADFRQWEGFAVYHKESVRLFVHSQDPQEVGVYFFVQWHLHRQLSEAREYAHRRKVILKGDIPIGISPNSVEAWAEPRLFNLSVQAGAPPDEFSVTGQNWGFPTYNWDAMEAQGYRWWRRRLQKMSEYFDAFRIDHLLGFFRIWEIPKHSVEGLLGYFNPALPYTVEEIEAFGFNFLPDRFLRPFVREWHLKTLFGKESEKARFFFKSEEGERLAFRKEFDSQRKIEQFFAHPDNSGYLSLREGLMSLHNEVLFIEDPVHSFRYHPRIAAVQTRSYAELSEGQQRAFRLLHDDFFYHRNDHFWQEQALKKLPALLDSTRMLVCAEDLGMIPACVPPVIRELQLLSLEIQRMPKDSKHSFGQTCMYPYLSVATTGTHDMSTLRQWWGEDRSVIKAYYRDVLWREDVAPVECTVEVVRQILVNHLVSPSMMTILPFQDWVAIDPVLRSATPERERINEPSNPRHYWRYRMHISLEKLLLSADFNQHVRRLIEQSGRL